MSVSAIADKPAEKRQGFRRVWRILWRIALVVVLLPLVLVPLYRFVPPVSVLMVYSGLTGQGMDRTFVPLSEIAPSLPASVLMAEDGQFCTHAGVDWDELAKVIEDDDERPRGASTIAMQTVKNLFLWQSRSYIRKAIEIPLALYADFVWGKPRTMEIYLNVAEWGPGIFGAEAAARHYFGRSAADLTDGQSALLAATLPNPAVRNPADPGPRLNSMARRIAGRAAQSGAYIGCLAP